jgi:hypothetical protein
MARQLGKVGTIKIRRHRLVFRIEVKAAQFLWWELLKQALPSFAGGQPLSLQFLEINRLGYVFTLEIALLKARMAVRGIEEK